MPSFQVPVPELFLAHVQCCICGSFFTVTVLYAYAERGLDQGAIGVNEGFLSVSMMAEGNRGLIELQSVLISEHRKSSTAGFSLDRMSLYECEL